MRIAQLSCEDFIKAPLLRGPNPVSTNKDPRSSQMFLSGRNSIHALASVGRCEKNLQVVQFSGRWHVTLTPHHTTWFSKFLVTMPHFHFTFTINSFNSHIPYLSFPSASHISCSYIPIIHLSLFFISIL